MENNVMLITGTRKGIGRYLAEYYANKGFTVIGCSRHTSGFDHPAYTHYCLDITDEAKTKSLFRDIQKKYGGLDVLINNAGMASMNHILLTPLSTVKSIFETNFMGAFLFCREGAKLMMKKKSGRIVNFSTIATALKLEGEAIYASSKSAIEMLTKVMSKELASNGITVNCLGLTPVETDLIKAVPEEKKQAILNRQSLPRYGNFDDITNVVDFFIKKESCFITGQTLYLGGISC